MLTVFNQNLRSAEEMEEEEKEAQSAKLQELIRRGTPADLQEANRLMKVMAGFDNRHKTDYRAKAAEEVAKVQQKAKILEEMLQSQKPGDGVPEGDVFEVSDPCLYLYMGCMLVADTPIHRSLPMLCKVRIPRSRRCARRNRMTLRLFISCWKSTTAYIALSSVTSWFERATSMQHREFPRALWVPRLACPRTQTMNSL